jgi:hypothetical protein
MSVAYTNDPSTDLLLTCDFIPGNSFTYQLQLGAVYSIKVEKLVGILQKYHSCIANLKALIS